MKILCVSDQIDPLIYSSSIKQRYGDIDLILAAGDLPLDYLDFINSTLNKPMCFVLGNHHTGDYSHDNSGVWQYNGCENCECHSSGATCVDTKVRYEEGLIIAGLGGSMCYNRGENQFSDFQMYIRMLKLFPGLIFNRIFRGRYVDILLTHAAPRGIHDREDKCHIGFKCFVWFIKVFRPKYLVHGHIHLYDLSELRTTKYNDTLVINAFSHYIIDTGVAI